MNDSKQVDLAVIGAGPGGYVAAIRASQLGMKTTIIERDRPGGLCLNWGCIPSKSLLKSAELYESLKKGSVYGLKVENIGFDLGAIVDRSRSVSERIVKGVEYLFKKYQIEHIKGTASLVSPSELRVESEGKTISIQSERILIATGSRPKDLPGVKRDGERIISSKEAMLLKTLPERLVVIGAGAIGMEFAYYYNCLGSNVTILEALDRVLPVGDDEISQLLAKMFKRKGVKIETGARVSSIECQGDEVHILYETGETNKELTADVTLVAIGVEPNIDTLGLDRLGIQTYKHGISVDERMRTSIPGIYAIGDVIGPPWLAHAASAEGILAVEEMAGKNPAPINHDAIPGCVYCHPEAASVGYTEQKAKEAGIEYTVGRYDFRACGRAIASGDTDGFVKLLFDRKDNTLIGAHIVGEKRQR